MQVLLQFSNLPAELQKSDLALSGVEIKTYVGDNTYLAIIQPSARLNPLQVALLAAVVNIDPQWKAANYLWNKLKISKTM